MGLEAQGVEPGAAAEDVVVPRDRAREVRQRIRWIGDHDQDRVGGRREDPGDHVAIDLRVPVEQPEPSFGVHAVGGTSRATPRIAAAKAHAEPTLPAPTIPTFMADLSEWTQPY